MDETSDKLQQKDGMRIEARNKLGFPVQPSTVDPDHMLLAVYDRSDSSGTSRMGNSLPRREEVEGDDQFVYELEAERCHIAVDVIQPGGIST